MSDKPANIDLKKKNTDWALAFGYVFGMLALLAVVVGFGLFVRSCQHETVACRQKTYDDCARAGRTECALASEVVCTGQK